ncbi:MAG TPA: zinc-binding alcohol dehydrogenase family protein [Gaiellaceae bacterium]|nr:zinc-binding alcohol dehydrogenase family protein [Gaiellaceae bacterium]
MRAAHIAELEVPPACVDIEAPLDANVTIEAVALNPLDISVGRGSFYGGHPPLPYVPGCEAVGRAEDGSLVYLFGEGRGIARDGFLAKRVAFASPLPVPEGVEPAVAAAAGIAGIAAWVPVAWKAKVGPDDRVLVLGASGTVGRIALQVATLLGAERVVGAARMAAGDIIALDDVADAFGDAGFTVCIDPIWGEPLARVLSLAAPHARIVHVGQAAGPEAPLRSADVRSKELQILGHSNFALSPQERNRAYLELLAEIAAGHITIEVELHSLEDVAAAWERQRAGAKVVIAL